MQRCFWWGSGSREAKANQQEYCSDTIEGCLQCLVSSVRIILIFQILLSQKCCLLMTPLCCPMSMTSCRPCSTGSEFMPTGNLWRWTHTNLRWCASTPGLITACLLSIMTACNYPTPSHSNTFWAWCVTKRHCLNMLLQLQRAFLWHATRSLEDSDMMRLSQITTLTLDVSMGNE